MTQKQHIAVVGAGWAGLATAVALCQQGYKVSLFESSPQLGGRARSIKWNDLTLDNGQHLMLGAYQQMLQCLNTLQADIPALFKRLPYRMLMLDAQTGQHAFDLKLPTFPAPLHLLFGVLNSPSLNTTEKISCLYHFNKLLNTPIISDISVSNWLDSAKLPSIYVENSLYPICLAALTTQPQKASARAFQRVLQQTFNAPASFTDLLIPTTDLNKTYPDLAEQFILQHDGEIHFRSKVQQLNIDNHQVKSIQVNDQTLTFDQVILATPARVTARLLAPIANCQSQVNQIKQLKFESITTLYLQFEQPVELPYPMLGVVNGLSEWVFTRGISGYNHLLSVIISANDKHLQMSQTQLTETIYAELNVIIANLPRLIDSKLICDKHAAFQCQPNVDTNRPDINTKVKNLKLCGDYVFIEEKNTPGLPSTLEGALLSGVKCAQTIISSNN